ncbi:ubiquitin carboxyl-terminal hydrolase [Cystoisospora suis]|uniref:Ubiquitin carboxyl-terminal hydrolase n=1 Tax=Cystoisospora suis TaxID=483139 RepID=A0A2C6L4E7_9APIC|nr:ubiquitin carboxyl-terminal hydrolase [Cystoisospora suis]
MYVHRVYAAELLPLLGTPAPAVASVCSAPASSPPLLSAPRSPRFQLKNEKPGNSCRQTGTASRKLISDSMSNAFPSSVNRTSGSSACVNLDFSTLSPRQHAFVGKQRASPSGPFPSYASERNTIPVKQEVHSAAAKTYESSPSACRQNGTIGGCLRALFLSDASLVSREAMAISPLHQPVGTDLPSFTLMHRSSTDKGAPMQKQNSTAYDFIFGTHAQTEDSRDDSWGNVDSGGSLSLEADLQKFQQLFQLTKAIRLAPRGSRAKQKGAAFRKGIGGGETGDKGGSLADGNPWDALSTRKQRGDCGQCRGSQTVTLDRHCMHAPTIFVCSLVWPPDFAQLPASSSASGESSCRAATPRSSPIKGVKTQDELRERVLLLLQGLEPVLDVPAIFSEMDSPRRPGSSPVLAHNVGGETASSAQTRRDPSGRRPFRAAAAREVEAFSADVAGKHVFRGMVCFYGQHYVCFFYHWASAKWVLFDDSRVKRALTWKTVLEMCVGGKLLPCLLFFEKISLRRSRHIDVCSSSSSASFPPSAVSTTSPLTSVFMSNSEFLSNPCSPSIPLAEVFGRGVALRDDPERNTPGSRTTGEEFFSSSDSEREAEPSLPSDAWNRFLSGNDNGGQRKSDEEYGKEGLQLFCAEMLSCQSFSLSDLSDKAAKRGVSSVPVGCGVEDSTSAAAPCRVS